MLYIEFVCLFVCVFDRFSLYLMNSFFVALINFSSSFLLLMTRVFKSKEFRLGFSLGFSFLN